MESVPRDRDRIFKVIDVSQVFCIVSHPALRGGTKALFQAENLAF